MAIKMAERKKKRYSPPPCPKCGSAETWVYRTEKPVRYCLCCDCQHRFTHADSSK